MDFAQAEQEFRLLEASRQAGTLDDETYRTRINALQVTDERGRVWMLQERTGQWYVWENGAWQIGEPHRPAATATAVPPPPPVAPAPMPTQTQAPASAMPPPARRGRSVSACRKHPSRSADQGPWHQRPGICVSFDSLGLTAGGCPLYQPELWCLPTGRLAVYCRCGCPGAGVDSLAAHAQLRRHH